MVRLRSETFFHGKFIIQKEAKPPAESSIQRATQEEQKEKSGSMQCSREKTGKGKYIFNEEIL